MVVVPQLCGDEKVLTTDRSVRDRLVECCADLIFIAVPLRTVEVSKTYLDRSPGGASRLIAIRNQCPEPERRNLAAASVQDKPELTQIFVSCHVLSLPICDFLFGLRLRRCAIRPLEIEIRPAVADLDPALVASALAWLRIHFSLA